MPDRAGFDWQPVRWAGFALIAVVAMGSIPTSSAYLAAGSQGFGQWLRFFSYIGPYYLMWAVASVGIYRLAVGVLHPRHGWTRAVAGHLVLLVVLSLAWGRVVHHENWQLWLFGGNAPGYHAMSVASYLLILLGIYLYRLERRVRHQQATISEQRERELGLQASLARSQVESLRGQMNPHFLFNALNCIGALIETRENDRAYEALEDLGTLLRTSLEHRDQELIPLADELAFAQRYVAMERVRFGERLGFDMRADSVARQWPVPPFVLQPLIENAIKHAVAPSREAVMIRVQATREDGRLELVVSNTNAAANRPARHGTGVGLGNLRQRLGLVYGDHASLHFEQDAEQTRVSLSLPDTPASAAGSTGKPADAADKRARARRALEIQHGAS
ncbi:MAG: histidine kinase [Xanthomonadales bacterium]|nr:histidine kinase [Xanthomonadales bacterium]